MKFGYHTGVFYVAWIAAWAVAAARLSPILAAPAKRHTVLSVAWLFLGPGQILFVCAAPLLFYDAARAAAASMRWYCRARTGVTYILAVLGSHLSTAVVSSSLLNGATEYDEVPRDEGAAHLPVRRSRGPLD